MSEVVACDFSGVGCEDKFARELEAEHVHMNSQSHLSLTAASLVRENLQLRQALLNQKQEFVGKLEDQGVKLCSQDELLQAQERKIHDLQKLLQDHETTSWQLSSSGSRWVSRLSRVPVQSQPLSFILQYTCRLLFRC